jgi:hypothetical protein
MTLLKKLVIVVKAGICQTYKLGDLLYSSEVFGTYMVTEGHTAELQQHHSHKSLCYLSILSLG